MKSKEERILELIEHLSKYHYTMSLGALSFSEDTLKAIHDTSDKQGNHPQA